MKNNKSLLLKSLIVSSAVLGTVALSDVAVDAATTTNNADTTQTDQSKSIVNRIVFTSNDVEIGNSATPVYGSSVGEKVDITDLIPAGYQTTDGNNTVTIHDNGSSLRVDLVKAQKVSNNIVFILDDDAKTEIGSTTVSGAKTGAKVQLTADQIPAGYVLKNANSITLQPDGNQQLVTVTVKPQTEVQSLKGTVATLNKITPLYQKDGTKIATRSLGANSDWATDQKMSLNGEDYYRVSTSEWVKASDVYQYAANPTTVTTKDGGVVPLYDNNGTKLTTRAVSGNSAWYSDRTITVDGQQYYRVSTTEWVSGADLK